MVREQRKASFSSREDARTPGTQESLVCIGADSMDKMRVAQELGELRGKLAAALVEDAGVLFAYLFGSLARDQATPLSDIDVAVFLEERTVSAEHKLDLLGALIDHLGSDQIDLVVLNSATLPLKARIVRDGAILVDRKPHSRHAFESLVLREYFDFSMFEGAILRRRFLLG